MRLRGERSGLALVVAAAGVLLGVGAPPTALTAAAPIAGTYRGAHLMQVAGTLAGGFTVRAGETWTISKICTIEAGTLLEQYTPAGGSSYQVRWLNVWVPMDPDAPGAKCEFVFDGGPITVTVTASSTGLAIEDCTGDACALSGQSLKRVGATTTTTKPTTTVAKPTPKPKAKDTTPPRVSAVTNKGFAKQGDTIPLVFSLKDDSGLATAHVTVYEGGKRLGTTVTKLLHADGVTGLNWTVPADAKGPLYFCVWAGDAAGNKSSENRDAFTQPEFRDEPGRSCAWIPLIVPVEQVSNTCGGEGWKAFVEVQHYFGNVHTYTDPKTKQSYNVDFSHACNVHDAGYGGHAVWDEFAGGKPHDFRTKSREAIDKLFLTNMQKACDEQLVGAPATVIATCKGTGGATSIGATYLYNLVKKIGWRFFDADLTKPGLQTTGHRDNFY